MKTSKVAALWAAIACLSALAWPAPAAAQCMAGPPVDAFSDEWKKIFRDGPSALSVFNGGQTLLVTGTTSYGLMSLSSPYAPFGMKTEDLQVAYPSCPKDCGLMSAAGSWDGSYFMIGTVGWGLGSWVFQGAGGSAYTPVGHFDAEGPNVGIHVANGRYLGISSSAINALVGPVFADLATASGTLSSALPSEGLIPYFPAYTPVSAGPYVVLSDAAELYVLLAEPLGAVPALMAGTQKYKFTTFDLGAGQDDILMAVAAAVDPKDLSATPSLYLFTRFINLTNSDLAIVSYRLARFSGGTVDDLGVFTPPGNFANAQYSMMHPVGAITVGDNPIFFGWAGDDPAAESSVIRLYSFQVSTFTSPVYSDFYRSDIPFVGASAYLAAGTGGAYGYLGTPDTLEVVGMTCSTLPMGDAGVHLFPSDGGTSSADGSVVKFDGSVGKPDGSVFKPDAGCTAGGTCFSAGGCKVGKLACSGTATCGQLTNVADGTSCGAGGQCVAGACILCQQGVSCDGPDGCTTGLWSCSGVPTCTQLTPKWDGAPCGASKVCYQSQCIPCVAGGKCTSVDGCQNGRVSCSTGQPACEPPFTHEADGTLCSGTGKCQGGVCSSCTDGAKCVSQNGCQQGTVTCAGGAGCGGYKDLADGTSCKGGACSAGACVSCVAGIACETQDGCASGTTTCSVGAVKCSNVTFKTNGTPCVGGVCSNGVCKIPPDAGTPILPDAEAVVDSDAATGPSDATAVKADTGGSTVAPQGCGCQSGIGTAWSTLILATGAMFLRRRRR